MTAPSFRFVADGRSLIDAANALRLDLHQGPEYSASITLGPAGGADPRAWLYKQNAYFQFGFSDRDAAGMPIVHLTYAVIHQSFESHYPGRLAELLDNVLPLLGPYFAAQWPVAPATPIATAPDRLRASLLAKRSYFP